jgi:hypothetical protein
VKEQERIKRNEKGKAGSKGRNPGYFGDRQGFIQKHKAEEGP